MYSSSIALIFQFFFSYPNQHCLILRLPHSLCLPLTEHFFQLKHYSPCKNKTVISTAQRIHQKQTLSKHIPYVWYSIMKFSRRHLCTSARNVSPGASNSQGAPLRTLTRAFRLPWWLPCALLLVPLCHAGRDVEGLGEFFRRSKLNKNISSCGKFYI